MDSRYHCVNCRVVGFGFGLINLANLVVVQQHTTRRRVLAAALAMTGCVLGAFILPFLVRHAFFCFFINSRLLYYQHRIRILLVDERV